MLFVLVFAIICAPAATPVSALPLALPHNVSIAVIAQLPGLASSASSSSSSSPSSSSLLSSLSWSSLASTSAPRSADDAGPTRDAWEHAAASKLAMVEINNSTTLLPNNTLRLHFYDTQGSPLSALGGVVTLCDPFRAGPSPSLAVVGLFTTEVASVAAIGAAMLETPIVSDWAPGTQLSNADTYPTLSRIQSTDEVEASVILRLIRHFGWRRFAVVAPGYTGGVAFANELTLQGERAGLPLSAMASAFVTRSDDDTTNALEFDDAVRQLKSIYERGFRVIVLHFFTFEMPTVMAAVQYLGMNTDAFVFIGTRFWVFDVALPGQLIDATTGRSLLDGALGVSVRYDSTSPVHERVIASWQHEFATNPSNVLNISEPRISFVRYDAVYAVAHALHRISAADRVCNRTTSSLSTRIDDGNNTCANLTTHSSVLRVLQRYVRESSFTGVTGVIKFDDDGNRIADMSVINVQDTVMTHVGTAYPRYRADDRRYLDITDAAVRFYGDSATVPSDTTASDFEVLTPKNSVVVTIVVLTVISVVWVVAMVVFNVYYRNDVAVKMSSPNINLLTLLGAGMCLVFVMLSCIRASSSGWSSPRYVTYCISSYWMLTLGFTLFFGSLFAKTYRVHRLFHALEHLNKGRPKKIYDTDLVKQIAVLLLFDCILMAMWSGDDFERKRETHSVEFDPRRRFTSVVVVSEVCTSNNFKTFVAVISLTKIGLVFFGCWLAYEVRNVRIPALNDSRWIGISIYTLVLLGLTAGPVILTVNDVDVAFFVIHFSAIVMVDMVLLALFGPQLHTVATHQQKKVVSEHHDASTHNNNNNTAESGRRSSTTADDLYACSACAQTVATLRKRIVALEDRARSQSAANSHAPAVDSRATTTAAAATAVTNLSEAGGSSAMTINIELV